MSGSTGLKNIYSGKTLLLVEDEVLIAMHEAEILESYGFRIISAASAEDAIAAVREKKIDLILMDIDLGQGNKDGTEAAETILEDHDIPVVFLSSHTEPEIVEKTENITSYGYVVKNSGETVLLASIKMAFRLCDVLQKRIEKSNQLDTLLDNAEDFIGRLDCRIVPEQAEDERRLNEARLESLLKLHDMTEATEKELAQIVLEESERLTQSEIGFINYLSEDETMVTHAVYTANTLRQCTLPDNVSAFNISACGLWSEAYRRRRPIIMNDYTMEHAAKVGFPEGHPVLHRFISIPVFKGDHVVAVAALGNKKTDYNQGDVRQFRLFMEGLWQTIQRREAEEQFKAIADYSYDWEDWIGPVRKLIWINPAVERITGYTPEECYRMPDYPFSLVHEGDRETVRAELEKSLEEKTSIQNRVFRCLCKDGTQKWISICWQSIYDTADNFMGLRSSLRDITERINTQIELQQTLKEKDYLMGEINHRVKNNLAIISSLIHLKNSALGDAVDLSDIENQITAISLVHEKLYKSESITHIDFKDYIQDLLTTVFSSFTKKRVAIENSIGDVSLPTKTAVTLGLIINEIATNAIKYGFTSDSEAVFTAAMEKDTMEQRYILTLANTGNPFPPEVDLDHPATLGLRLISALVGQLKGRIELERARHPVFTIRFPAA